MTRINLTDADSDANRQGRLSAAQRRRVQGQRLLWLSGTLGLAACGLVLVAVLLRKVTTPTFADRGQLLIIVPLLLFWGWLLRVMPRRLLAATRDLRDGRVAMSEGTARLDVTFGLGLFTPAHRRVRVGAQVFGISAAVQRQFEPGARYRIYHTPHGRQFLGALALVATRAEAAPVAPLLEPLTPREVEVVQLIAAGLSNKEIAAQLSLSVNTIKMYASQAYRKLGVSRRTEAAARARELDLIC